MRIRIETFLSAGQDSGFFYSADPDPVFFLKRIRIPGNIFCSRKLPWSDVAAKQYSTYGTVQSLDEKIKDIFFQKLQLFDDFVEFFVVLTFNS